jgi:hypothetical protein
MADRKGLLQVSMQRWWSDGSKGNSKNLQQRYFTHLGLKLFYEYPAFNRLSWTARQSG